MYTTGDDIEDNEVLTPGHFLIGRPPLDVVESIQDNEKIGILDRWRLIQNMKTKFLMTLQQRYK